jgi:hypothetical protein
MCQSTGKRLNDYHRLKSTQEYIVALSSDAGIPASNIIQVVKGVQKGVWLVNQFNRNKYTNFYVVDL